ncbi:hypothetical protein RB601_007308 [Gaeumannomyces tritici]
MQMQMPPSTCTSSSPREPAPGAPAAATTGGATAPAPEPATSYSIGEDTSNSSTATPEHRASTATARESCGAHAHHKKDGSLTGGPKDLVDFDSAVLRFPSHQQLANEPAQVAAPNVYLQKPAPDLAGINNKNNNSHLDAIHPSPNQSDHAAAAAAAAATTATLASSSSSPSTSPIPRRVSARKPSPGLAARLKALGFGGSRKQSPPPSGRSDANVGRLPEDQLRQLDQGHQAGSEATIVERRGRPWKGALVRIPSTSSLKGWSSRSKPDKERASAEASEDAGPSTDLEPPHILPEIQAPSPLDMDTNKFRLPDHTNGNGTKAQPETREQHVARGGPSPPPSPEPNSPPPPPPPKDTPPLPPAAPANASSMEFSPDSYFNPLGLQRTGSIYTLSRASFANQLAQLTSLQLPDAESLSGKVAAIPTAQAAARALIGAAEQIRNWISKAAEVIGGLDSEDDVEWSAAGGREGLEEVESAIHRFEGLIKVYLSAIEDLNSRLDIESVAPDDLQKTVMQMDAITKEWAGIHDTLRTVKRQVEIAMEWEELWNMVLGEIQNEMEDLSRLVFEMEERRHKSIMAATSGTENVDISDLETIVEETPPPATRLQAKQNRFSLPVFPASPSSPVPPSMSQEDSRLLALFARMQPLRASLDFLPMRLSAFQARADKIFPTACDELEMRRMGLDGSYRKLEKDAENLRRELGEDRWVLVFRGAGRQAQKMYESVERSMAKLKEAVDAGMHLTNAPMMGKKIESYEAKKTHYGPAVERVLSIIDRGIKDRLTVNGEILRLHTELQAKWEELKDRLREMDSTLEEVAVSHKGQQLRDSISSMLSNDRSTLGSGHDTPQSSPPSSVIMSSLGLDMGTPTNQSINKRRSSSMGSHLPQPSNRRSSTTTGALGSSLTRKPVSRLATTGSLTVPGRDSSGSVTPQAKRTPSRPPSTIPGRPRWSMSTTGIDTGHNFKPLQPDATPSPQTSASKLPFRSPLSRAASSSPMPDDTPPRSVNRMSFRERLASPGPYSQLTLSKTRLSNQTPLPAVGNRRVSMPPERPDDLSAGSQRSVSSLASTRRASLFPNPRSPSERVGSAMGGRSSPQALAGARAAMRNGHSNVSDQKQAGDGKPRWRF